MVCDLLGEGSGQSGHSRLSRNHGRLALAGSEFFEMCAVLNSPKS
jgi:hypothetical protein